MTVCAGGYAMMCTFCFSPVPFNDYVAFRFMGGRDINFAHWKCINNEAVSVEIVRSVRFGERQGDKPEPYEDLYD